MATTSQNALSLLLVASFILAMVSPSFSCPTYYCEEKIDETWYLRQVGSGPNQNQKVIVLNSTDVSEFGTLVVNNWAVLDAPNPNANVLAHARGMHLQAGQAGVSWYMTLTIVFDGARFNGSTLHVTGIADAEGQWAIGGGTGQLTSAHGAIKHLLLKGGSPVENYRQLDVHAFYTPTTAIEAGVAIM